MGKREEAAAAAEREAREIADLEEWSTALLNRVKDDHRVSREVLVGNESFVIGVLQAVSGGSLVATISQFAILESTVGRIAVAEFITILAFALMFAVAAAFLKYQYKLWDVRAGVERQNSAEEWAHVIKGMSWADPKSHLVGALRRAKWGRRYRSAMRAALWLSVLAFSWALAFLVYQIWKRALGPLQMGPGANEFIQRFQQLHSAVRVSLVGVVIILSACWLYRGLKRWRARKRMANKIREAASNGLAR